MFTPQFFDILVIVVAVVGLVLAGLRIASDFRQGPRFAALDITNSATASIDASHAVSPIQVPQVPPVQPPTQESKP